MFPIRDDAPRAGTPFITYFLLVLNSVIFLAMWLGVPAPAQLVVNYFGFVPVKVTALLRGAEYVNLSGALVPANTESALLPVLTSMFLHASWLHLIFNMWGLYIFGDNLEDHLGHFRYLIFYLLTGIAATAVHWAFNPASRVPSVGASGAIAGVMGGYFILFPSARVLTVLPLFFYFSFLWLPAWLVLGYWFVAQFLSGAATSIAQSQQTGGGVAFWAHVGGFAAGAILIKLFPTRPKRYQFYGY
jgi:membrane associated rhomboid family serine protease